MRKSLIILIITIIGLFSCGQERKSNQIKNTADIERLESIKTNENQRWQADNFKKYIDTTYWYNDTIGKSLIIQNSFPKGGEYYDSSETGYGYRIFWTRIVNETDNPVELIINFPADSLAISSSPETYIKLILGTDTMTVDKLSSYNYGSTSLKSFLENNINESAVLKRTVNPGEESIFLVGLIIRVYGTVRAGLVFKGNDLFYKVSIDSIGTKLIPCGQFDFKKYQ